MALNQNQFTLSPVQGMLDLQGFGSNVVSCIVDNAQATSLVAGQPVKLSSTAGGDPHVISLAANTDQTFGFIAYNLKDAAYPADARVEVALFGSIMHMTSGGAIARGASVEVVYTTNTVITSGGTNPVVGFAYGSSTGSGQLLRVYIQAPFAQVNAALSGSTKTITAVATLAQINAGLTLIPGVSGQAITVTNYTARVAGGFATGTSVELESTNASPVAVSTIAEAGLTNGAVLTPASANTTLGVGFAAALGSGDGLKVVNNGSAQTGGTSITYTITYTQQ